MKNNLRLFVCPLLLALGLPCAAQCELEGRALLHNARAQNCDSRPLSQWYTAKRWRFSLGFLQTYQPDATLPLGLKLEKGDRLYFSHETTRFISLEKHF